MGARDEIITSRKNSLVRRAVAAREGRERGLVFVEGVRLCEEAARAALDIEAVIYAPALESDERAARLLNQLPGRAARALAADPTVLEFVSDTKTSQGVIVLARRPRTGPESLEGGDTAPLVVIMHGVNNPSNAGAMLRVAEAAGATAAVATAASAGLTHTELDWTTPRAVLVGPEAGGLSEEEVSAAAEAVRIPMRPPVESLNVAVALGVVLYEAARQRNLR